MCEFTEVFIKRGVSVRELKEKKKYKGSMLLRLAILSLAGFLVISLVNRQVEITTMKSDLDGINQELKVQNIKNDELRYTLDQGLELEDYAEKAARRELDYAKPQEKVFINIGGTD